MTIDELAEYLKIRVNTIRVWLMQKRIPVLRPGRRVRFRRSDIDAWLAAS